MSDTKNAYAFSFTSLNNTEELKLAHFEGKVLLIVNTASRCGFTPQYAKLESLYQEYKEEGLVIIGIPCNDFGAQEPGSSQEIADFCQSHYDISFPMTHKEKVCGEQAHPFYLWAKESLGFGTAPKWNFHKYLINRRGQLIDYFHSSTSPQSPRLKKMIIRALKEEI